MKGWNLYILTHENEDAGPYCEYPYKCGTCRVYFHWIEKGNPVKLPKIKKHTATKWVRVKSKKHLMELFS